MGVTGVRDGGKNMSENRTRFRLDQRRAPIYEALEQFRQMRVVPFDVPGHKRGRGNPELTAFLGQQCVGVDVNSMKPLDMVWLVESWLCWVLLQRLLPVAIRDVYKRQFFRGSPSWQLRYLDHTGSTSLPGSCRSGRILYYRVGDKLL